MRAESRAEFRTAAGPVVRALFGGATPCEPEAAALSTSNAVEMAVHVCPGSDARAARAFSGSPRRWRGDAAGSSRVAMFVALVRAPMQKKSFGLQRVFTFASLGDAPTSNHAMQRTAGRLALNFCDDYNLFTPGHAPPRPLSLILFSLDDYAFRHISS